MDKSMQFIWILGHKDSSVFFSTSSHSGQIRKAFDLLVYFNELEEHNLDSSLFDSLQHLRRTQDHFENLITGFWKAK